MDFSSQETLARISQLRMLYGYSNWYVEPVWHRPMGHAAPANGHTAPAEGTRKGSICVGHWTSGPCPLSQYHWLPEYSISATRSVVGEPVTGSLSMVH